jgi:hypothetical protein
MKFVMIEGKAIDPNEVEAVVPGIYGDNGQVYSWTTLRFKSGKTIELQATVDEVVAAFNPPRACSKCHKINRHAGATHCLHCDARLV